MKKMFFIAVVLLTNFSLVLAQGRDISGIYIDNAGPEFHVKNNDMFFIIPQGGNAITYESDTLAICTLKNIGTEFIELNSKTPDEQILTTMKIGQKYNSLGMGQKRIIFDIPCQYDLLIEVFANDCKSFKLDYSTTNNIVCLPEQVRSFNYTVELKRVLMPHGVEGNFCGIIRYISKEIKFEDDKNTVIISLPSMTCSFFERYYIKGEYARIVGDTIVWKGRSFIKENQ